MKILHRPDDQVRCSQTQTGWLSELESRIKDSFRYSGRVRLGIALFVLVILPTTLRQLPKILSAFRALPPIDDISQYERRFGGVKQLLPPDQVVWYRDDFDKISEQCEALELAQYSLAPTVLVGFNSKCDSSDETSALGSRFVLDNFHDARIEPYIVSLFSSIGVPPNNNPAHGVGRQLPGAEHIVLVKDFGLGVKLYSRGDK
jgi:hypothetical protein